MLQPLIDFAEARLDGAAFATVLLSDQAVEEWLTTVPESPAFTEALGGLYFWLLDLDLERPDHLLDARAEIGRALEAAGELGSERVWGAPDDFLADVARAVPPWLEVPGGYLTILQSDYEASGRPAGWLKTELRQRFRCLKRPPRWLQTQLWPVRDGVPAVFVGQLDAGDGAHDSAQLYVFLHADRDPEVIIQTA